VRTDRLVVAAEIKDGVVENVILVVGVAADPPRRAAAPSF
jgi:hypothetical protein